MNCAYKQDIQIVQTKPLCITLERNLIYGTSVLVDFVASNKQNTQNDSMDPTAQIFSLYDVMQPITHFTRYTYELRRSKW